MKKNFTAFFIVLIYGVIGPIFPSLITFIGSQDSAFDKKVLALSYAIGFLPSVASGTYLAYKSTRQQPFEKSTYFLAAIIAGAFTACSWGPYAIFAIPVVATIAAIVAAIFLLIARAILLKTSFALIKPSTSVAGT